MKLLPGVGNSQAQALCRQQVDAYVPGPPHASTLVALSFCGSCCIVRGSWREGLSWVCTLGLLRCVWLGSGASLRKLFWAGGHVLLREDVADVCLGPDVFRP